MLQRPGPDVYNELVISGMPSLRIGHDLGRRAHLIAGSS